MPMEDEVMIEVAAPPCRVLLASAGASHSVALLSGNVVCSWGRGEDGQLGHGDTDDRLLPTKLSALDGQNIISVTCGADHTMARSESGRNVYSWGWGDFGRLGHGDHSDMFIPHPIRALQGLMIQQIACGDSHCLSVTLDSQVLSWGHNQNGELGIGTTEDSLLPQKVKKFEGIPVKMVAAGAEHSVAITADGNLYGWGWGRYGNLGLGDRNDRLLPEKVTVDGYKITLVACGWRHTICVSSSGGLYTYGWGKYGQLGHGDFEDHLVPRKVEALRDKFISQVSGGWRHSMALTSRGQLLGWGWNKFGQIGVGNNLDCCSPMQVNFPYDQKVHQVSCGWRHTIAVTQRQNVFSWGRGANGQLGNGQTLDRNVPTIIEAFSVDGSSGQYIQTSKSCSSSGKSSSFISDRYAVVPDETDKGVLLTTYDIVRNNSKSLRGNNYLDDEESGDDATWDYMILDEGHLIKNPSTQRAKSLLEIPSAHRIIISGTPLQNNLKELWALFNFCCPELLGDNKWFKEKFEKPILRGNDKHASDREQRVGSSVAKELRDRIQPYFLRRMKSEVFSQGDEKTTTKLSQKQEIIVWLRLTSVQRYLYEAFLKSEIVLSAFDGSPLAALTILKKICDHPLLLTKRAAEDVLEGMDSMLKPEEANIATKLAMHIADVADTDRFRDEQDVSCKISFIMSLLDNLIPKGHCVLIFSQTRKMLNLIQECLLSQGYDFLRIDGTTKASDRLKIVNDFQEGVGAPIFLLTSQVGGLGLTLTKADRVIVVDPAWNPSTDNQSVDRAYRIGQKKDVIVYRLMTCGTVEEKIYRKQVYKGGLFKTATEHKEQIRYFSQQDLRELFSLPKEGFDVSVTQRQLNEEHDRQYRVDDSFKAHIEFLKSQGIAGVSHHSLLFSKTGPPVHDELEGDEVTRNHGTRYIGTSRSSSYDHITYGSEFAFNPKDVTKSKKGSSPSSAGKLTESEIKDKINRLSQTLSNAAMISKLPDKGEKLQKRLAELSLELAELKSERNVIDLDDFTTEFQQGLNI